MWHPCLSNTGGSGKVIDIAATKLFSLFGSGILLIESDRSKGKRRVAAARDALTTTVSSSGSSSAASSVSLPVESTDNLTGACSGTEWPTKRVLGLFGVPDVSGPFLEDGSGLLYVMPE